MQTYSVRSGDTLSALAKRFGTSVAEIAKANNISNPNRINVGQKIVIPDGFEGPRKQSAPSKGDSFGSGGSAPAAAAGNGGPVRDSNGRQFPTSADGTPMYKQGDAEWGSRTLGRSSSLAAAGCAMTATAMAVSKITGKAINPGQMDAWLDKNGGYSGNALMWGKAASMGGLGASKSAWNLDTINKQIDAGRPVVVGVDYKAGSNGGSNGTDHWITITGRGKEGGKDVYYANDPATGKQITLSNQGGRLTGGPQGYKTTGELVTFSGGNPRPGTAPANQGGGSAPANGTGGTGGTQAPARGTMSGLSLPSGDLERGARGAAVEQLQRALVKGGFMTQAEMSTGPGIFGPKTEAALKEFQAANGVDAIGRYGPKTRAAFEKLGAKVGGGGSTAPSGPVTGPTAPTGNGGGGVSLDQLRRIMPNLSQAKAEQYLPHLNNAMREAGITTRNQKAAFLAQLAHESGQFRYMEEIASGAAYEGRRDLGNTQPGDGVRFKGRGPIQLTGRANYTAAGKALGLDLVNNPKQAATPEVGFRTAAWFWNTRGLNSLAEAGNFREVTRRINGGFNGLADREMYYRRALTVLG